MSAPKLPASTLRARRCDYSEDPCPPLPSARYMHGPGSRLEPLLAEPSFRRPGLPLNTSKGLTIAPDGFGSALRRHEPLVPVLPCLLEIGRRQVARLPSDRHCAGTCESFGKDGSQHIGNERAPIVADAYKCLDFNRNR